MISIIDAIIGSGCKSMKERVYNWRPLFCSIFVGFASLIVLIPIQILSVSMGFDTLSSEFYLNSVNGVLLFTLIIAIIAYFTGELFKNLNQSFCERFSCIFLYHLFFFYGFRMFDQYVRGSEINFFPDILLHAVPAITFAFLVSLFWKPQKVSKQFSHQIRLVVKQIGLKKLIIKLCMAWLCFIVTFYFMHKLITPFLEQFEGNMFLTISNSFLIISFIGFLFPVIALPIFMRWQRSKATMLYWVGFPIFIQVALFSGVYDLTVPKGIDFFYFIQNTAIVFLVAIFYVQLFFIPKEDEVIHDQFHWMY